MCCSVIIVSSKLHEMLRNNIGFIDFRVMITRLVRRTYVVSPCFILNGHVRIVVIEEYAGGICRIFKSASTGDKTRHVSCGSMIRRDGYHRSDTEEVSVRGFPWFNLIQVGVFFNSSWICSGFHDEGSLLLILSVREPTTGQEPLFLSMLTSNSPALLLDRGSPAVSMEQFTL